MLVSPRVRGSRQALSNMSLNTELNGAQNARVQESLTGKAAVLETAELVPQFQKATSDIATTSTLHIDENTGPSAASGGDPPQEQPVLNAETVDPVVSESQGPEMNIAETHDAETHAALVAFLAEHAAELAAEPHKPFQAIGGIYDELAEETVPKATAVAASASPAVTSPTPAPLGGMLRPATHKKLVNPQDEQRGSVLQKIAKLDVRGRIQLAMKGTKEERSILVRDGTKIVAIAVLDSPKISDGEVEKFANQKNVLEAVLRAIPMKRRFAKNYAVIRNLVFNPRTPLDVALGLMKNLLVQDLRHLSGNKEVPDTVRKLALRMFKQKSENANKK